MDSHMNFVPPYGAPCQALGYGNGYYKCLVELNKPCISRSHGAVFKLSVCEDLSAVAMLQWFLALFLCSQPSFRFLTKVQRRWVGERRTRRKLNGFLPRFPLMDFDEKEVLIHVLSYSDNSLLYFFDCGSMEVITFWEVFDWLSLDKDYFRSLQPIGEHGGRLGSMVVDWERWGWLGRCLIDFLFIKTTF